MTPEPRMPRSTDEQQEVAHIAGCSRERVSEYVNRPHYLSPHERQQIETAVIAWRTQGRLL